MNNLESLAVSALSESDIHRLVAQAIRDKIHSTGLAIGSPEYDAAVRMYGKRKTRKRGTKEGMKGETEKQERAG